MSKLTQEDLEAILRQRVCDGNWITVMCRKIRAGEFSEDDKVRAQKQLHEFLGLSYSSRIHRNGEPRCDVRIMRLLSRDWPGKSRKLSSLKGVAAFVVQLFEGFDLYVLREPAPKRPGNHYYLHVRRL